LAKLWGRNAILIVTLVRWGFSGELQKERGARAPVPRPPYRGGTVNAVR